ncbi:MAG: hypothetical protein ABIT71_11545, partial [Vicinamibacteraceae bacterium]
MCEPVGAQLNRWRHPPDSGTSNRAAMSHLPALVADNILLLEQCADVLEALPYGVFATPDDRCLGGSIGGHVRHCLEHYGSFLAGLDSGLLDYDHRARDRRLQSERPAACAALRATATALARTLTFTRLDRPVRVMAEGETSDGDVTLSSIGRELSFLLSHTIHHCALIA